MRILKDIRFWLILGFIVRLTGITHAPLESHAWRQTITNMAAKNFTLHNPNILYPTVDVMFFDTVDTSGVSPMEFPIYNYSISLMARIFGWADWYGRLINLIVSTFGLWYFYLIVRDYINKKLGEISTYLLMGSLWLTFSRKIMPDTFSMSLVLIGLYYGLKYLYELKNEKKNLFLFFLFSTIGILSKIPAIFLFAVIPFYDHIIALRKRLTLILVGLLGLIPIYWWYFVWCPQLIIRFNNRMFFTGKGLIQGFLEIQGHFIQMSDHLTKFAFSYSGFAFLVFGLFLLIKNKEKKILSLCGVLTLIYIVFILKSGYNFVHHNYYIIPFVPVLCLIAGYFLTQIKKPWLFILMISIYTVDNISRKQHDFRIPKRDLYRLNTQNIVDQFVPANSLIATNGGPSPVDIYFTGRKGWSMMQMEMTKEKILTLKSRGATHLIINRHNHDYQFSFEKLYEDQDFRIYRL
ncbi:MAG: ArnT family glycosyltransferase [Bacteriovoracaceae bacterium]